MIRWILLFVSLSAFLSGVLCAQLPSTNNVPTFGRSAGSISGAVRGIDEKPLSDVRVEVRDLATGRVVASGYTLPNGSFEFSSLRRGSYEIVASSGVQEARQRVDFLQPQSLVIIRLAQGSERDPNGASTVSIAQLKVPEKAAKAYNKAREAFAKNKRDEALTHLETALRLFPEYAQALTLRGLLYIDDEKPQQALGPLEQAVKYDYGYGMGYVVLGAAYNMLSRYDDATRSLQHAIALLPTSWQAQFEMSKAELGKGQYQEALRHVDRAAELAPPQFGAIHLVRAHALLGLKNYSNAVTELEQYLGANPKGAASAQARETLDRARAFVAANPGK